MATAKEVFEILPHVNEVWITKDGHHHLDDTKGGEKISRKDEAKEKKEKKETDAADTGAKK